MKKRTSKYLEFYEKYVWNETMPEPGLCYCFPNNRLLNRFIPVVGEANYYWGAGFPDDYEKRIEQKFKFNALRQTIVLFMHEMTVNPI